MNSIKSSELLSLIKHYRKNWKLFLLSFVVCAGLAAAYILITNPKFDVASNVLIKEDSGSGMSSAASDLMKGMAFGDMLDVGGSNVDDEFEVISSYSILHDAVKQLGLNTKYIESEFPKKTDHYKDSPISLTPVNTSMADTFVNYVKFKVHVDKQQKVDVKAKFKFSTIGEVKDGKFPVKIDTRFGSFILDKTEHFQPDKKLNMKILFFGYAGTTESLQKQLGIKVTNKKANAISLSIQDESKQRGIDLLNTIVDCYNSYGIAEKNIVAKRTIDFMQQRIDLMDSELKDIEIEIENYKTENNLTDIDAEAKIILDKSSNFKEQLINTETQFTVISMIEDFLQAPENRYAVVPMSLGIKEESAVESLLKYNELLLERLKLLRSTNPGNPAIESMNEQVDATRQSVLVTIQSIKRGIEYARDDLRMQEQTFLNRIKGMPHQEREFIEIKRQQEIKQALFIFLLQQREQNSLKLAVSNPKAQVIDAAFAYNVPAWPKNKVIGLVVLFFTLVIPIFYLYLRRLLSSKISSEAGGIQSSDLISAGNIAHAAQSLLLQGSDSTADEDIRNLRLNAMKMSQAAESNLLLVASMEKGEGKSFVATNLALSMAKADKSVLLVDGNFRNPSLDELASGNGSSTGLYDAAHSASITLGEIVHPSNLDEQLNIVLSGVRGKKYADYPETMLNARFQALIAEAKTKYDFVILDTSALKNYSDTMPLLSSQCAILFVLRDKFSDKKDISYIESIINSQDLKHAACVVNDVKAQ